MDVVQTSQCPELKTFIIKQLGKGNNYREIGDKFGVSASTACEKVNTADTDENLCRLVSVPMARHDARVLHILLVRS